MSTCSTLNLSASRAFSSTRLSGNCHTVDRRRERSVNHYEIAHHQRAIERLSSSLCATARKRPTHERNACHFEPIVEEAHLEQCGEGNGRREKQRWKRISGKRFIHQPSGLTKKADCRCDVDSRDEKEPKYANFGEERRVLEERRCRPSRPLNQRAYRGNAEGRTCPTRPCGRPGRR